MTNLTLNMSTTNKTSHSHTSLITTPSVSTVSPHTAPCCSHVTTNNALMFTSQSLTSVPLPPNFHYGLAILENIELHSP